VIESLNLLDRTLFLAINSLNAPWLNPVMKYISGQLVWIPFISIIIWNSKKFEDSKKMGIFIAFMLLTIMASDVTSSYIIKNLAERLRPCRVADLKLLIQAFGQKCGGRFGFVSSHAANSMALVCFSLFSLPKRPKYLHLLWALPFIVGWSRIYLGVHYPGDILCGLMIGIMWGFFFSKLFENISTAPVVATSSHSRL
jgi:undecaprenyl-diphosphatase